MKKVLLLLMILIPMNVFAEDITANSKITVNDVVNSKLTDKNENSYATIDKGNKITISNDDNISGLYIIYELKSIEGIITNGDSEEKIGTNGYLHEYIDVSKLIGKSNEINLIYNEQVKIGEIYVLSDGELPEYVEVWEDSCDEADLLLLSTHSDDEQLFFAGLMPYYVAKGAKVQVVYFTNHNDNPRRLHEQLHGLYTVGIRNYPVFGNVPDAWSDNLEWALKNLKNAGLTEEDAIKFEVENIRRFKPLVLVGHDELGEYSHGQHILNTYILKKAIEKTNDETYDTESVTKYGLWDTPKTYLHLYKENPIVMNYDEPLDYFNGKTAYEVSCEGYSKHLSQQYTWFTKWLTGVNDKGVGTKFTSAKEITKYSPLEYGLYRSLVGEDVNKNDMFENLTLRKDEKNNENVSDKIVKDIKKNIKKHSILLKNKNVYYIAGGIGILLIICIIAKICKKK